MMKKFVSALGVFVIFGLPVFGQEAKTIPIGVVTITIGGAPSGSSKTTSLSLPLLSPATITGQVSGRITGVSANSISNSNAAWATGQLSQAATPFLIRITSGAAQGRTFLISTASANTASTVFIDSEDANLVNLTSLGILTGANGDTYEILQCDTLSEFFGTPANGIVGGTSATNADVVRISVGGAWRDYYFNTVSGSWIQIGPNTPANNTPIRPDAAVSYKRVGTSPLNLVFTGRVPHLQRQATIRNSGETYLSNGWPVNMTLGNSNIQNIPGWVSSSNPMIADTVTVFAFGAWRTYHHNGIQWIRSGVNTPSNGIVIPSQGGVILLKRGNAGGSAPLSQQVPYVL